MKQLFPKSSPWALKMSGTATQKPDSALLILAAVGLALVTILSVWKLNQFKYRLITETGGAMFYGMLVGLLVRCLPLDRGDNMETVCTCGGLNRTPHLLIINGTSHFGRVNQRCPPVSTPHTETFDPEVLFNLFLPPIIFHGAYTLNQKRFIGNLGAVLTFAFLGTTISCVTIGACVYGFTRLMVLLGQAADGDFLLTDCLLFGAIMSATDPVAVLGLLSELRVDLDLHALLFGESVLNDAVAIVLTHAITTYSQMGAGHIFNPPAFFLSVGYFLGLLASSFLLGFIFTVITALLTKFTRLCENPLLETSVFFLLSWSSFLSAEASGLSGFRGAVAFSLAIRDTSTEVRRTILTTTLLLVGFTIWVLGTAADPMLRRLNIRVGVDADENPEELSVEVATGRPDTSGGLWHSLDYKYLKPVLTHRGPPLTDSLPQWCGVFARLFSSRHVQEGEEQLCETEPDDSTLESVKTENQRGSLGGDSGSAHQEDLLDGDLGLGTAPALAREA